MNTNRIAASCGIATVMLFLGINHAFADIASDMANGGAGATAVGSLGPTFYAFNSLQKTVVTSLAAPPADSSRQEIRGINGKVIGSYNPSIITVAGSPTAVSLNDIVNMEGMGLLRAER